MKKLLPFLLVSSAIAMPALAHNDGELFVRGGIATVMPNSSSDDVLGTGELEVDDNSQLGLTLTWMATENWGIELLAATPFTHSVETDGLGEVAEVSHLPPTLTAQYYFGNAKSSFRPYVGVGVNYTLFFDEEGKGALAGTDVSLENSLGVAVQGGMDYLINDNWLANVGVWWIDINSDVDTAVGTIEAEVDPLVVMASIGYRF